MSARVRGFTKEWHRATVGSADPALCGKRPPRGRPWKAAPKAADGTDQLKPCAACEFRYFAGAMWLAA